MRFSIIVVCLNAGEKLRKTIESIQAQSFQDYEVLVKDGGSTDGCLDFLTGTEETIRVVVEKDQGIYDAMNQAVKQVCGDYVYFLNCGDLFYSSDVLEKMDQVIARHVTRHGIYYGNIYEHLTGQRVNSNPDLNDFGCYRNVPCHQACFYDRQLLLDHPFETKYQVRADYEQFLWCYFTTQYAERVSLIYHDILIADYEGGGFSEEKKNRIRSKEEHREIVRKYMSHAQILKYQWILYMTLSPIRTRLSQNEKTAGLYNQIKRTIYRKGAANGEE